VWARKVCLHAKCVGVVCAVLVSVQLLRLVNAVHSSFRMLWCSGARQQFGRMPFPTRPMTDMDDTAGLELRLVQCKSNALTLGHDCASLSVLTNVVVVQT